MSRNRQIVAVALLLTVAAALRLTALDWDGYEHYHPDERYMAWVATTIEAPDRLRGAFVPHTSSFNPFYWPPDASSEGIVVPQDEPRSFAYGHLPLYLGVLTTRVVERISPTLRTLAPDEWPFTRVILNGDGYNEFRHLTAVSRALTALFDTGTILFVFLLGRRLFGPAVGLIAAAFLAINVMHLQLARFFTVDPFLSFFTVASVYFSSGVAEASSRRLAYRNVALASIAIGLAVGSKFSAVLLILPFGIAIWVWSGKKTLHRRRTLALAAILVLAVFALTNPFAVLDWSCDVITPQLRLGSVTFPPLNLGSCYLDNVFRQSAMVRGDAGFDFTRQYVGTWPYVYPLLMQLRWGMGYALGVPAIAGFAWAIARGGRKLRARSRRGVDDRAPSREAAGRAEVVVLAWTGVYFLVTGAFFAKFMRYMQPLTPFLMIYAAAFLWIVLGRSWRQLAVGTVAIVTALYAVAFMSMYQDEHPWNEASRWIYENVPPGANFTSEIWDDPLPGSIEVEGEFYNRHIYEFGEVNWLTGTASSDDEAKLKLNLSRVAQADYLVLSSNRGYGVVTRLHRLYPLSHQYYERLFAGKLGFDVVLVTGRGPHLGAFSIWPDRFGETGLALPKPIMDFLEVYADFSPGKADESFTVYDQPMAIILYNRQRLTVDEMLSTFQRP